MAKITTLTTKISQAELEELEKHYTFRGREEVLRFINENPFLVPVLLQAPEVIGRYFGNTSLDLRVSVDPEIVNYLQLLLFIATDLEPEKAAAKLFELNLDSWLDSYGDAEDRLCILLDYK